MFGTLEIDNLTSNAINSKKIEILSRLNDKKIEAKTFNDAISIKTIESFEKEIDKKNQQIKEMEQTHFKEMNKLRNKNNDSSSDTESKLNDSLTQKITDSPRNQSVNYVERYINDLNKSEVEKEILFNIDLEIIELNQINKSNIANEENSFKNKYYQLMECN